MQADNAAEVKVTRYCHRNITGRDLLPNIFPSLIESYKSDWVRQVTSCPLTHLNAKADQRNALVHSRPACTYCSCKRSRPSTIPTPSRTVYSKPGAKFLR